MCGHALSLRVVAPGEFIVPPVDGSAACGLAVVIDNRGGRPVEVDLADGIELEYRTDGGAWSRWNRGGNGTSPGPHSIVIEPGGSARVDLAARVHRSTIGPSIKGEDQTGARWWVGPIQGCERSISLRASIRLPGQTVFSDPICISIPPEFSD